MSHLAKTIRTHRALNRTRREIDRAIQNAATPSMRDELLIAAQRDGSIYSR